MIDAYDPQRRYVLREQFSDAWSLQLYPQIEDYLLPQDHGDAVAHTLDLIHLDLEWRVKDGDEPAIIVSYWNRFGDCLSDADRVELVNMEYQFRWRYGRRISHDAFVDRIPADARAGLERLEPEWNCRSCDGEMLRLASIDDDSVSCPLCGQTFPTATVFAPPSEPWKQSDCPEWLRRELVNKKHIDGGGYGDIYQIHDARLFQRVLAIKILHRKHAENPQTVELFEQECEIIATLQHPNIPPIHDRGILPDGSPYYTMRFIDGKPFNKVLDSVRELPAADSQREALVNTNLTVLETVIRAMAYAHAKGIIHRDLKPKNIFVGDLGEVFVLDWGVAQLKSDPESSVRGTWQYMAPEQALRETIGFTADVFSLGAILCEILTGRPVYYRDKQSESELEQCVREGDVDPGLKRLEALAHNPAWSGEHELLELAKQMISAKPKGRPADAAELLKELTAWRDAQGKRAKERDAAEAKRAEAEQRAHAEGERARAESERAQAESERAQAQSERARAEGERARAESSRALAAGKAKRRAWALLCVSALAVWWIWSANSDLKEQTKVAEAQRAEAVTQKQLADERGRELVHQLEIAEDQRRKLESSRKLTLDALAELLKVDNGEKDAAAQPHAALVGRLAELHGDDEEAEAIQAALMQAIQNGSPAQRRRLGKALLALKPSSDSDSTQILYVALLKCVIANSELDLNMTGEGLAMAGEAEQSLKKYEQLVRDQIAKREETEDALSNVREMRHMLAHCYYQAATQLYDADPPRSRELLAHTGELFVSGADDVTQGAAKALESYRTLVFIKIIAEAGANERLPSKKAEAHLALLNQIAEWITRHRLQESESVDTGLLVSDCYIARALLQLQTSNLETLNTDVRSATSLLTDSIIKAADDDSIKIELGLFTGLATKCFMELGPDESVELLLDKMDVMMRLHPQAADATARELRAGFKRLREMAQTTLERVTLYAKDGKIQEAEVLLNEAFAKTSHSIARREMARCYARIAVVQLNERPWMELPASERRIVNRYAEKAIDVLIELPSYATEASFLTSDKDFQVLNVSPRFAELTAPRTESP